LLKSKNIFLRALQPTDVEHIFKWENNPENWENSGTSRSYTKEEISEFVNDKQDLEKSNQFRFIICLNLTDEPIGAIDLFEYNTQKSIVGVGILIAEKENRRRGFAKESLNLISNYCRNELNIVNLFCNIKKDNVSSICLFENNGFKFIEEKDLFKRKVNYYEKTL